ncbi:ESPR domain-containing protein, partial [Burkholderia cepacia]
MNKIYKNVWCEKTGTYVAASETAKGRRAGGTSAVVGALTAVVLLGGGSFASPDVYAAAFVVCGNASTAALIPTGPTTSYNMGCTTGSDVLFMGGYSGGPGINSGASTSTTWITVNNATTPSSSVTGSIPGQSIELYAPGSIILNGSNVNVSSNKIINLANGTVAAGSGDAVNGGQLFTLSTSTSTGLSSATSSISSLSTSTSTGLSSANSSITSLSTSASTGLSSATSSISSLSTSTSTGISSLSTGLSSANSTVSSLSTS